MKQHTLIALNEDDDGAPEEKIITGIVFDGGNKTVAEAVRDHPWQTIGIALGVGALIGCLLARRTRS